MTIIINAQAPMPPARSAEITGRRRNVARSATAVFGHHRRSIWRSASQIRGSSASSVSERRLRHFRSTPVAGCFEAAASTGRRLEFIDRRVKGASRFIIGWSDVRHNVGTAVGREETVMWLPPNSRNHPRATVRCLDQHASECDVDGAVGWGDAHLRAKYRPAHRLLSGFRP